MVDPFVVLTDRLAGVTRGDGQEHRPARGLLERSWVETIERSLRVENKTGKAVSLALTVVDHPAAELSFERSEPAPTTANAPEYRYDLAIAPDQELTVKIVLRAARKESIRLPAEKVQVMSRANVSEPVFQAIAQSAQNDVPIAQGMQENTTPEGDEQD